MTSLDIPVSDASAVALARREAVRLGARLGLGEVASGQLALVATELASNLVKHAGGGRLLLGPGRRGIDLLALDSGPGMRDVAACLADGYSSAGTAGNGLGAVRRLSSHFGVASWPGLGTVVHAHVGLTAADAGGGVDAAAAGRPAAVVVAKPGEAACGDAWAWRDGADHRTVMVVDGLGHGTEAALAAREAVELFAKHGGAAPAALVQALHQGLRHTRGGAVAVARVQWSSGTIAFAGLGNIAGAVVGSDGPVRRMVSHNGTAGHNARKVQAFEYPFTSGVLVMHTDGVSGQWSFDRFPGLLRCHPALIAGVLYGHHARGRDDAAVVVTRLERP